MHACGCVRNRRQETNVLIVSILPAVVVNLALRREMMMFIGTHSVTTTLNVHSRSRSFVSAIDLRGLAPSMRLFRRPNTNGMKK